MLVSEDLSYKIKRMYVQVMRMTSLIRVSSFHSFFKLKQKMKKTELFFFSICLHNCKPEKTFAFFFLIVFFILMSVIGFEKTRLYLVYSFSVLF